MALLITPPSDNVRSPLPKRFRFSLKQQDKCQFQESDYVSTKKSSSADTSTNKDDMLIDKFDVQDENVSPNCKVPEIKLSSFVNLEVVDKKCEVSSLGLPNCGNTCYLNSILQVLRYTPNFLNCVHSLISLQNWLDQVFPNCNKVKEEDLFHKLHTLFNTMKKQEDFLFSNFEDDVSSFLLAYIESFLLSLREVSSSFEEGEQHDAHELLLTILSTFATFHDCVKSNVACCSKSQNLVQPDAKEPSNKLPNVSKRKEKRKSKKKSILVVDSSQAGKSLIACLTNQDLLNFALIIEGKIRHTVKCLECEKKSERDESFTNLEISFADDLIDEGSVDLCQCLDHRVILSGTDKYFCSSCFHLNEAQLSSEIILLPSVLLIHCNWLKQSSTVTYIEKDSTRLLIPTCLKTSENPNIFHLTSDDIYCLYAVVLHLGTSTENGHYVSFVRDRSKASGLMKENHTNLESCCANDKILNIKPNSVNRWLLFDDQNVTPISVSENSDIFPYYQFLGIAASPCILFYYKM